MQHAFLRYYSILYYNSARQEMLSFLRGAIMLLQLQKNRKERMKWISGLGKISAGTGRGGYSTSRDSLPPGAGCGSRHFPRGRASSSGCGRM